MMKKEEIFTLLCFTSFTLRYFIGHFIKYNAFVVYCSIESTFIDRGYRITDKHSIDKVRAYQTSKRGDKNTRHISICELHGFLCNWLSAQDLQYVQFHSKPGVIYFIITIFSEIQFWSFSYVRSRILCQNVLKKSPLSSLKLERIVQCITSVYRCTAVVGEKNCWLLGSFSEVKKLQTIGKIGT